MSPTGQTRQTGPTRGRILKQMLGLLRQQWAGLGAGDFPAAGSDRPDVYDPEALMIAGALYGRDDPKLFREVNIWLDAHGDLVNAQRLGNIIESFDAETQPHILFAVTEIIGEHRKELKWRKLFKTKKGSKGASAFSYDAVEPNKLLEAAEPVAQAYSFDGDAAMRPRPLPMGTNASLLLRLREFFGVNMRADIINYLLGNEDGYPREIARALFFSQKGVQDTLAGMARSGMVRVRSKGREKRYWLERDRWEVLAGPFPAPPQWRNWVLIFRAVIAAGAAMAGNANTPDGPGIEQTELLNQICKDLEDAGFARELPDIRNEDPDNALKQVAEAVLKILDSI
ncbi:MarR family transcriptional regulator [Planctomycetota bacterium]